MTATTAGISFLVLFAAISALTAPSLAAKKTRKADDRESLSFWNCTNTDEDGTPFTAAITSLYVDPVPARINNSLLVRIEGGKDRGGPNDTLNTIFVQLYQDVLDVVFSQQESFYTRGTVFNISFQTGQLPPTIVPGNYELIVSLGDYNGAFTCIRAPIRVVLPIGV